VSYNTVQHAYMSNISLIVTKKYILVYKWTLIIICFSVCPIKFALHCAQIEAQLKLAKVELTLLVLCLLYFEVSLFVP
jgi:hypothetical protein